MPEKVEDSGISEYLRKIGQKGGRAKVSKGFAKLTPEQRKAIAKKAAKARRKQRAARTSGRS